MISSNQLVQLSTSRIFPYLLAFIVWSFFTVFNAVAEEPVSKTTERKSPLSLIKNTIDQVIQVNKRLSGEDNLDQRRKELRAVIAPYFDFDEMAKRSLGAHWESINDLERREFIDVFSELLARTYLSRIDQVTTEIVEYEGERITPPKASVKTNINHKGDSFPIEYKFIDTDSSWKVYDVVIENIGLVANYRNEFAGIIRKEKFDGLMAKLKKKLDDKPTAESAEDRDTA